MTKTTNKRGRPRKLSRDAILDAAEDYSPDGLSIVRLAKSLFVTDAAIYYHFKSRNHLVRCVIERRAHNFKLPPDNLDWPDWIRNYALNIFDELGEIPGTASYMIAAGISGVNQTRIFETVISRLHNHGLSYDKGVKVYQAIVTSAIEAAHRQDEQSRYQSDTMRRSVRAHYGEIVVTDIITEPGLRDTMLEQGKMSIRAQLEFLLDMFLAGVTGK